jgi:hypothetical protein
LTIKARNLRAAAARSGSVVVAKSLNEALSRNKQIAFLCHSHKDQELAKGLQVLLKESGWDLYIDWKDNELPSSPNKATASKIKSKIESTDWFLFLATSNSTLSRWCPWEIGYADSIKGYEKMLIIPIEDDSGNWYGNEYLQLYKKVDEGTDKQTGKPAYAAFDVGSSSGTRVRDL